ncbi:380_t:CDS:2 [Paraglomus brasilianum]|uniref:380_t:CDS:1 n=1 Tax=Paraglomus brasilianum TaxID=144538 RepID=A0A9N9D1M8_9GLOM|nr:380_t:CDS:2 [Paraglomus brasilianum]
MSWSTPTTPSATTPTSVSSPHISFHPSNSDYSMQPSLPTYQLYQPIISIPQMSSRRNGVNTQIFPGGMGEFVNMTSRMVPQQQGLYLAQGMAQSGVIDIDKRPPKSTELFDPNGNGRSISNAGSVSLSTTTSQSPVVSPGNLGVSSPTWLATPNNKQTPSNSLLQPRRKHSNSNTNNSDNYTNSNDNTNTTNVLDGSMMRSLSLTSPSVGPQGRKEFGQMHSRSASASPGSVGKKKEQSGLLFDYSAQAPYEGVKPSDANKPPQPGHILELYDFAESDSLEDVTFSNATMKRIPPMVPTSKRPTILVVFKTSREANEVLQSRHGERFKIKMWAPLPLPKSSVGSVTSGSGE